MQLFNMKKTRFTWICLLVFLLYFIGISTGLKFLGSYNCYARYDMWNATTNGSLSFQFRTTNKEGLLAYMDDGGQYDFLELKITKGHVRLRFRIGDSAQTIMLGAELNDDNWHTVEVIRDFQKTTLTVDSSTKSGSSSDKDESTLTSKSDLFFGGILRDKLLTSLALPSVMFDTRFVGHIRNIRYGLGRGRWRNPELISSEGVEQHSSDVCSGKDSNPCLHDGVCSSSDSGATCDCKGTGYEGEFCNVVSSSSLASFDGSSYFTYDLSKKGIQTQEDVIQFEFRTQNPNGLILQTGNINDYVFFGLEDGMIAFAINLGSGPYAEVITSKNFNDNKWHKVVMTRKRQQVDIMIDDTTNLSGNTPGTYSSFTSKNLFYVGGAPTPKNLPGSSINSNFIGCLREISYSSSTLTLELSSLAKRSDPYISLVGNIPFTCKDPDQLEPITFTTEKAYLEVNKWEAKISGSLSYRFRTNEPNGVLMYNNGAQAMSDFFAMELRDGYLTMVLDLGSGAINVKCHPNRMDDGEWHFVKVNKNKKRGTVEVDEDTMPFVLGGQNKQLDLEGSLFIGGIDSGSNSMLLPREIWSGMLGFGFVGCMRDLVMNGVPVDLAEIARTTAALDVGVYCSAQPAKCNSDPCLNMGVCSEGWNRFICDCSATGFVGTTCSEDAVTLSFDGTQYLRVGFENEELSDREDVRLRFKTKRAYGILMSTVATNGIDTLMLELDSGRVKLTLNLGAGSIELFSGIGLNDMQWHTVKIERTLQHVKMWIDEEEVIEGSSTPPGGNTDGTNDVLEFYSIEIGALSDSAKANMLVTPSNFLGHMEQFVLNNQHFFEMANEGVGNIEYTADFDDMDKQIISEPVTFKTRDAYVVLSPPKTYPDLNLFFQFKTVEADGLILFNDGDGNDFMGVELVDGYIHYVYNTGDKTSVMIANTVTRLNNNAWHEVSVTRDNRDRLVLKVDDATTKAQSSSGPRHIDLTENMRVGGVEREMYDILPEMVESKNGFLGCMASLDLNGKVPDLINDALNGMTDSVVQGCEGPSQTCSADSCLNQGICNQLWDSYTCDCDMTTFTGSMCEIRGTKADFSNNGGLITFTYPERSRPTTYSDRLAIGFRTKSSDAVLARIDSSSSDDYIEVEIEEGNLFVVYNVGTDDHPIGRVLKKVNDGKYHVMRFHRIGQNATLQLDDEPVREMFPAGDQSKVFNDQTFVKLGARGQVKNRERRDLDRKYVGLMQGVFYNDIKVLDKGVARDSSVTVEGDVALRQSSQPGVKTTPSSPKASSPVMTTQMKALTPAKPVGPGEPGVETTTDDIYIEIGSGCNSDDEDDCDMSGSGEIPKPVGPSVGRTTTMAGVTEPKTTVPAMMTTKARMTTVKSTAQPTTRAPPKMTTPMVIDQATTLEPMIPEGSGVKCEGTDDEDCETDESGSGEIPIPMEPTTKSMMVEITKMTESPLTQPMKSKTTQAVMPPSSTTMVPEKGITTTAMMTDIKIELTTLKPMTNVTKKMQPIETNKQTEKPPSSKPTQTTAAEEGIAGPIAESSKNAGQTAMVIGIVAAVCIAVLILLYAIYKYRNRNEGSYRIDESRNYSYGAPNNTVVMPNANGALYNGKDGINKPLMKKQDSREWYV